MRFLDVFHKLEELNKMAPLSWSAHDDEIVIRWHVGSPIVRAFKQAGEMFAPR